MSSLIRLAALAGLIALPAAAQAQDVRTQEIRFAPGKSRAVVKGAIKGDGSASYTLGAEAGHVLKVVLKANASTSFNLYAPGRAPGQESLANGERTPEPNRFEGPLPASGVYTIDVYMNRAAARRNARSAFTLDVSIPPRPGAAAKPPAADFADGLQGGPDAWVVTGVAADDVLNLRRMPSARAPVVATRSNGAVLRNAGCRMVAEQRWCQVETTDAPVARGWVNGQFLKEGPALPAGQAAAPDLRADCRRFAAVDFLAKPEQIRVMGRRPGPEGSLVDATVNLGPQGVKPFACRFDPGGRYLGIMSKVDEGAL